VIRPEKHWNPRFSVVNIGGLVIQILKETAIMPFDELLAMLIRRTDRQVKEVFAPTLAFLFLLGKIQYHDKIDAIELIKSNETN
jgi:hypothetical protein